MLLEITTFNHEAFLWVHYIRLGNVLQIRIRNKGFNFFSKEEYSAQSSGLEQSLEERVTGAKTVKGNT
jgi:hypothetical protein